MPRLSLARLTPRRMLHLPSRTVRLRLTLLYSGLFLVSGVALLAITYLLFRSNTGVDLIVPTGTRAWVDQPGAHKCFAEPGRRPPGAPDVRRRPSHVTPTVSTRGSSSPGSRWRS